eukprot:CAMPEP_0201481464 /NCGR_PEP_ID=MMETSP0151_2-20130828/5756_1 /ASSEMBLY_ACC=CAM_ASM_000257 /TAXON_ID=200890 /ORGANISM="Paramoeba atlantica, Strain 621/1 / CCAP 1560/9" /LENGTH=106 /DNA_ID=CAMNT_0047863691 /DNA_START=101 /DNA_END=421 /DNA_ORIENTATION=+
MGDLEAEMSEVFSEGREEREKEKDELKGMTRDGRKIQVSTCSSCGKIKCRQCGHTVQLVALASSNANLQLSKKIYGDYSNTCDFFILIIVLFFFCLVSLLLSSMAD